MPEPPSSNQPMIVKNDDLYIDLVLAPLRTCARYKPAFGRSGDEGTSLSEFHVLYGMNPLYRWMGLDSDLMYAAHKAAGAMTSIYRQLGIGCERLFREVLKDSLALSQEEVTWRYKVEKEGGGTGILALDARMDTRTIRDPAAQHRCTDWIARVGSTLGFDPAARHLHGAVFEVRQGYKSADSKRQNADLRSGIRAYSEGYLPVIMLFSEQVNRAVERRYRAAHLLVLIGRVHGTDTASTYTFCREVIGYDVAAFFERNSSRLREEFLGILRNLLSP